MLFNIFRPFADQYALANLFRYITFRSGAACLTALFIAFILGPMVIRWLKSVQRGGQPIREDGPERHLVEKKGTPTMGGILILFALGFSTLLWADLRNSYVWAVMFVTFGYGLLGFCDDYQKLSKRNHRGISGRVLRSTITPTCCDKNCTTIRSTTSAAITSPSRKKQNTIAPDPSANSEFTGNPRSPADMAVEQQ